MKAFILTISLFLAAMAVIASPAHAYVGPGLGAGTLAVIAGIVASVFLAVFALVWYPLKRLLARMKSSATKSGGSSPEKKG